MVTWQTHLRGAQPLVRQTIHTFQLFSSFCICLRCFHCTKYSALNVLSRDSILNSALYQENNINWREISGSVSSVVLPERRSGGLSCWGHRGGMLLMEGWRNAWCFPELRVFTTQTGQTGLSNWVKALAGVLSGQNHKINKPQTSNKSNVSGWKVLRRISATFLSVTTLFLSRSSVFAFFFFFFLNTI